jgi:hypothetical protein
MKQSLRQQTLGLHSLRLHSLRQGILPRALLCVVASAVLASVMGSTLAAAERAGGSGRAKEITFDDIKLEMVKGDPYDSSLLTDKIKALDGQRIKIRGYILPGFQQNGIKQFVLVRDNMECCFGPGALLHDCILVAMVPPAETSFTVRPVSVSGKFTIREFKIEENGNILAIYHLDGTEVK